MLIELVKTNPFSFIIDRVHGILKTLTLTKTNARKTVKNEN
jgi:hypothetical protein